jgi:hypothetical protein
MTDLDPAIWDNPTLGAAANNERLDAIEKQQLENRNAKLEDREPREVVVENTYPDWKPELNPRTGTVASNYQVVHFADEQQSDIPVGSESIENTAGGLNEGSSEASGTVDDESSTDEFNSNEASSEALETEASSPFIGSSEESDGSTEWK